MRATLLAKAVTGYIPGIQKHYAKATLQLDGENWKAADLVTLFQECETTAAAVVAAEQQRADAVKAAAAAAAKAAPVAKAFKMAVLAAYGSQATVLADFDLEPPKVTEKSAEVKAAAARKAAETRKALGTMGKQQKKAAKKELVAQAAAPSTAPSQPGPATPAPAAAPTTPAKS